MAVQSKIEWTEATYNPWMGCKKVSPGCKYCYMFRDQERYGLNPTDVRKSKTKFNEPLKWKEPRLIFTCSWSDVFIEEADEWRDDFWEIIRKTPHHTYQILTKRPERIKDHLPADWGDGYDNVWLGVSAENQKMFDKRANILAEVPAKVRFISAEPLISDINMLSFFRENEEKIHWVIVGGESGNDTGKYRYRNCSTVWMDEIVTTCGLFDVPVFVKQLGTHLSKYFNHKDRHGKNMEEWPNYLRVREFPKSYIKTE